ncbi:hypothetical protein ACFWVC_20795 [Streptomyces sp. NPDC058691]|uniref:hypothetical protein n=1 Tax=Streptomyces sp. NPDC058691 TaxID=3346601 RepID=UPI0036586485
MSDTVRALRTPRAAGAVGIAFAVLLGAAIVMVRVAIPEGQHYAASGGPLSGDSRHTVRTALGLIPFAGIFFLWFIGAVRAHVGDAEDRFLATVFQGSGLIFVATLFGAAACAGSLLATADAGAADGARLPQLWFFGGHFTYSLLTTYAMRMAAVFVLSASTVALRLGTFPRWLALLGYLVGLTLLFVVPGVAWAELVFPIWALVVSLHILVAGFRREAAARLDGRGGREDASTGR